MSDFERSDADADATPGAPRDGFARALRGFGPVGLIAIAVIAAGNLLFLPLTGLLVLAWRWRTGTPWAAIGYVRPRSWVREALAGLAVGGVLKLVMKALVMPLIFADPVNHAFEHLRGNAAALPGMLYAIFLGAGFSEETFFRGFLVERGWALIGPQAMASGRLQGEVSALTVIVVATSALFGLAHLPEQGMPGAVHALIVGLVYGLIYVRYGRLWPVMWVHIGFDLVALWIIYAGLEEKVGRFVFG